MSEHKCELCGTPVKIVGKTTKHYEPLVSVASVPVSNEVISWLKLHLLNAKYWSPECDEKHFKSGLFCKDFDDFCKEHALLTGKGER